MLTEGLFMERGIQLMETGDGKSASWALYLSSRQQAELHNSRNEVSTHELLTKYSVLCATINLGLLLTGSTFSILALAGVACSGLGYAVSAKKKMRAIETIKDLKTIALSNAARLPPRIPNT